MENERDDEFDIFVLSWLINFMTEDEIYNYYYTTLLAKLHSTTSELIDINKDNKEIALKVLKAYGFYLPYITGRPENFASYRALKNPN